MIKYTSSPSWMIIMFHKSILNILCILRMAQKKHNGLSKNYWLEYKTIAFCFSNYTTFQTVTTYAIFEWKSTSHILTYFKTNPTYLINMSLTIKFHAWMQECTRISLWIIIAVINQNSGTTKWTNIKSVINRKCMYLRKYLKGGIRLRIHRVQCCFLLHSIKRGTSP